jgi:hypothetical protein
MDFSAEFVTFIFILRIPEGRHLHSHRIRTSNFICHYIVMNIFDQVMIARKYAQEEDKFHNEEIHNL